MNESPAPTRSPGQRILPFDALRGLAACVVLLHHFRLCFFPGDPRWFLRPFFAGTNAVVVFFVLSGYVLSSPYWSGRQLPYAEYLKRRLFRVYLPYAVAALVALLAASHFLYSHLPLTPWFYRMWQTPLSPTLILKLFLTMPVTGEVNTAFWSLRYEIEMSLILPLVCYLAMRLRGWWPLLGAVGVGLIGRFLFGHTAHSAALEEFAATLIWISCFLYGVAISYKRLAIARLYSGLPTWSRIVFLLAALAVLSSTKLMLLPIAACVVLITAYHTRLHSWLSSPVPQYLGRVSYSVYLLHATILYSAVNLLYGRLPLFALAAVYLVATFTLSTLFCFFVEEPVASLGRRVTRRRPSTSR